VNTVGKIAFAKVYPIDQGIDMNEIVQALRSVRFNRGGR
jgi:hypothetical protein